MRFPAAVLLLAALGALACGPSEPEPPSAIAIVGARLIDGTGAAPLDDAALVVEYGRITQVGPRGQVAVPDGAEVIDAAGLAVMPGIVDLHVHYFADDRAGMQRLFDAQLAWGVTTARSIGVDTPERFAVIRDAREGRLRAPRVFSAGLGFSHPEGHPVAQPDIHRPETPEQAREQVAALASQGVDFVKMWVDSKYGELPEISPEIQQAIVEAASRSRVPVVAHIYDEADVRRLVGYGVTDFLHTIRDREGLGSDLTAFLTDNNVSFAATLTVIEANWLLLERPELLDADARMRAGLSDVARKNLADAAWIESELASRPLDVLRPELERAQRFVRAAHEAGVWLTLGSDSGAGTIPTGWGSHREMQLLADAGVPPLEVIRIATAAGARRLGSQGEDIGTLEPGKIADLILLDADPTRDIANTTRIRRVMKSGEWVPDAQDSPSE